MPVDVLLGLQWGDEGKGKIVDYLSGSYDCIGRFQGGPNAGHTIIIGEQKFVLHTIPSGIFRPKTMNVIGNGVVIDPITLMDEIRGLEALDVNVKDALYIARKAHLILPTHRMLDAASEKAKGKEKIGSTLRGIGPTYMDKTGRNGLRIGHAEEADFRSQYEALKNKHLSLLKMYPEIEFNLEEEESMWFEALEQVKAYTMIDCEYFMNDQLSRGKNILAEGAQGSMLDIEYGTYPYVTSSNTISAGVCTGLGLAPQKIREVFGITKAYCTRVGSGPFPTELHDETGDFLRAAGHEFGATTGRPRRCGWIDLVQLKYTIMLNGVTQLVLTKVDVLNQMKEIKAATAYVQDGKKVQSVPFGYSSKQFDIEYSNHSGWMTELDQVLDFTSLPGQAQQYIAYLEEFLGVKVSMISTGPERSRLIAK